MKRLAVLACLGVVMPMAQAQKPAASVPRDLEVDWSQQHRFFVVGAGQQAGNVQVKGGLYQVELQGFPVGTQWRAGELTGVTRQARQVVTVADMRIGLADRPFAALGAFDPPVDPQLVLVLTRPDGAQLQVKLPAMPLGRVWDMLAAVPGAPLRFQGEAVGDSDVIRSVATPMGAPRHLVGLGEVARLADIHAVALITRGPTEGTKVCGGYVAADLFGKALPGGRPLPDIEVEQQATEVAVYRRTTGRLLAQKTFPASPDCPQRYLTVGRDRRVPSPLPEDAIGRWLEGQLGR